MHLEPATILSYAFAAFGAFSLFDLLVVLVLMRRGSPIQGQVESTRAEPRVLREAREIVNYTLVGR